MHDKAEGPKGLISFSDKKKEQDKKKVVEVFIEIPPNTPVEFKNKTVILSPPSGQKVSGFGEAEVQEVIVITFKEESLLVPRSQFNRIMTGMNYTLEEYDEKKIHQEECDS